MKIKFAFASIIAAAAFSATAGAQEVKPMGLTVRAGAFFPTEARGKAVGKTWFGGGIEYKLGDLNFSGSPEGMSGEYSISVDYFNKGNLRNIPVNLNWVGRSQGIFYTVGAGVGMTRTVTAAAVRQNRSAFSYQVGVGYEFNKGTGTPVFVELKYIGSSKSQLNGWGAFAGIRF